MKPREIIEITLCVVASFSLAQLFVNQFVMHGAFQRFVMRIGFQVQLFVLIYLFFYSRDISQKLSELEKRFDKVHRERNNSRDIGEKTENQVMEG